MKTKVGSDKSIRRKGEQKWSRRKGGKTVEEDDD
jgi:hypothetical protein